VGWHGASSAGLGEVKVGEDFTIEIERDAQLGVRLGKMVGDTSGSAAL
jgi:hypothetical protein